MRAVLATTGLTVAIGDRVLCRGLDLHVRPGCLVAVLGPNGAGKSTLLQVLAGLRGAATGQVLLDGRPYASWNGRAAARRRGWLPQQQPDHFASTVLETVLVGRHPHLGRWAWEGAADLAIARAALAELGVAELESRNVLQLSGGERQRVALAALLAQQPDLFLLDEPLSHLDLHFQIVLLDCFRRRADAGASVVMVMHDINLAGRYADEVILLDGREGVVAGATADILTEEHLSHAFRHPLRAATVDGRRVFHPQ